jgi:hypothetical protein
MACHDVNLVCPTSFVSKQTHVLFWFAKCVRAAANPIKRLPPHQHVGPTLRRCQIHSMNHEPPKNQYAMRTIFINIITLCTISCCYCYYYYYYYCYYFVLTKLWTVPRSSCTPCSPGKPTLLACPLRNVVQIGTRLRNLPGTAKKQFYSDPLTQYTHILCYLSRGRHRREQAPVSKFVHTPDLAYFKFTPCSPLDQLPMHLLHCHLGDVCWACNELCRGCLQI